MSSLISDAPLASRPRADRRGRIRRLCQAICDAETSTTEAGLMEKLVEELTAGQWTPDPRSHPDWFGSDRS